MWVSPMPCEVLPADDQGMKLTRTLMSLSVLAATGFGVVAASPSAAAQEKVCVHRTTRLAGQHTEGATTYLYYENVCDSWMDTSGPEDPTPPKDDDDGKEVPMTREEECADRAAQLDDLERSLRWADQNVLALEAAVGAYDRQETDAGRAESDAADAALAADVALATAQAAYDAAGHDTTRTQIVNRREVEVYIGYNVSTPEGKAVVNAQAAQRAAHAALQAARNANGASHTNGQAEGDARRNLDDARSILASYPMQIEQLRHEYAERC